MSGPVSQPKVAACSFKFIRRPNSTRLITDLFCYRTIVLLQSNSERELQMNAAQYKEFHMTELSQWSVVALLSSESNNTASTCLIQFPRAGRQCSYWHQQYASSVWEINIRLCAHFQLTYHHNLGFGWLFILSLLV